MLERFLFWAVVVIAGMIVFSGIEDGGPMFPPSVRESSVARLISWFSLYWDEILIYSVFLVLGSVLAFLVWDLFEPVPLYH